jgi:hypothetical protein
MGKALTNIQEYHAMCAYQFELGYIWPYSPVATCPRVLRLWISFGILWWEIDGGGRGLPCLIFWTDCFGLL